MKSKNSLKHQASIENLLFFKYEMYEYASIIKTINTGNFKKAFEYIFGCFAFDPSSYLILSDYKTIDSDYTMKTCRRRLYYKNTKNSIKEEIEYDAEGRIYQIYRYNRNGDSNGECITYGTSGYIERIGSYYNGKKCGLHKSFYQNGKIRDEAFFTNGIKKNGYHKEYTTDGELYKSTYYDKHGIGFDQFNYEKTKWKNDKVDWEHQWRTYIGLNNTK